jgi:cell division protein FtsB
VHLTAAWRNSPASEDLEPMRWLLFVLVLLLGILQYRLWFAEGSLAEQHRLELQIEETTRVNSELQARNAILEREVMELQSGNKGVEQRAREQLGLVREGETFYHIVEKETPAAEAKP